MFKGDAISQRQQKKGGNFPYGEHKMSVSSMLPGPLLGFSKHAGHGRTWLILLTLKPSAPRVNQNTKRLLSFHLHSTELSLQDRYASVLSLLTPLQKLEIIRWLIRQLKRSMGRWNWNNAIQCNYYNCNILGIEAQLRPMPRSLHTEVRT